MGTSTAQRHDQRDVVGPVALAPAVGGGLTAPRRSERREGCVNECHLAADSSGTLIRVGNDLLISGESWITIFPGLMLVLIALSVNLLGDWLRDALNPRLR